MLNNEEDRVVFNLARILAAPMPDGCTVRDYLEDCLPKKLDLAALGISAKGYGISDIRADIHDHFYDLLVRAILTAAVDHSSEGIERAVAVERERCAVIAEGVTAATDFQASKGAHEELDRTVSRARLDIARDIRAGTVPSVMTPNVRVKPLDESKNVGWTDDKDRFCLPLSAGYFVKFPKESDPSPMYMAWFYHDPVGGSADFKETKRLAQEHHARRILASIDVGRSISSAKPPGGCCEEAAV